MDIELARTFLEISRCGSFVAAADKLHVTQTAVTARVRNLETALGCTLFVRNRSGAKLTTDGEAFTQFASHLVQTWDKARLDLPLPAGHDDKISLGSETVLWNPLVLNWLGWMHEHHPATGLSLVTGNAGELYQRLENGSLDLALVYRADYLPQFHIKLLLEEKLVQVQAAPGDYVFVDWGENFTVQHDRALPGYSNAAVHFDFGTMALQYILQHGGSGYFRERAVAEFIEQGLLSKVSSAPEFGYPVYLVRLANSASPLMERAVQGVASVAAKEVERG